MTPRISKAFFSYSREDSEFALRLARDLRASGASVWLDQLDIQAGERWDRAVESALSECSCLIVILSPSSIASNNVMDEVSYALEERRTVIPVLHRDCKIPFRLRRLQYIDCRLDYNRGLNGILTNLHGSAAAPRPQAEPQYATPQYAPPAWQQAPPPAAPTFSTPAASSKDKYVITGVIAAVVLALLAWGLLSWSRQAASSASAEQKQPPVSIPVAPASDPPRSTVATDLPPKPAGDAAPVAKPSFSCAKPYGPIETLLCRDAPLAQVELGTSTTYAQLMAQLPEADKPALLADQRQWLTKYIKECNAFAPGGNIEAPGFHDCVEQHLNERMKALQNWKTSPVPASSAPTESPQRVTVGGVAQQANLVHKVTPAYPQLAKTARVQGTVIMSAIIGTDGTVKKLDVISGHPLLVPDALEAVRQWVYKPMLLNGTPVEVMTQIEVNFTLSQ
jgi:TonB family protein